MLDEARYSLRYFINASPLYPPIGRLRHRASDHWNVSRDVELVYEGFGRSGSSFAVWAFKLAQGRPVRVVHHTHASATVVAAVKLGIPTAVIVRDPRSTVVSHMARRAVSARAALVAWVRFHERIIPFRDRIVVVPFDALIVDAGDPIRRVNDRFGTRFEVFDHTPDNEQAVFAAIDDLNRTRTAEEAPRSLARPTVERTRRKQLLASEYEHDRLAALRARAEAAEATLLSP